MRYRKLDENFDMTWGNGVRDYHQDNVEAVGQAIRTRLLLFTGEWFLDLTAGMPWGGFRTTEEAVRTGQVLGLQSPGRDMAIRMCILGTPGVSSLANYTSRYDGTSRRLQVTATVDTIYGSLALNVPLAVPMDSGFALSGSALGGGAPL